MVLLRRIWHRVAGRSQTGAVLPLAVFGLGSAGHHAVHGVSEIDTLSVFGNGMMIWGNIPIMLIFAPYALRAFADYKRRLRAGEFDSN